jgi:hypothetical protein
MAQRSGTLAVRNLSAFLYACGHAEADTTKFVKDAMRESGEIVRSRAAATFSRIDAGSAAGFTTRVRQKGVAVGQRRRKVTGKRGDYGAMQMRHLLRARHDSYPRFVHELEHALDRIADRFQWGG